MTDFAIFDCLVYYIFCFGVFFFLFLNSRLPPTCLWGDTFISYSLATRNAEIWGIVEQLENFKIRLTVITRERVIFKQQTPI